jgi:hypothetical protein
MFADQIEKMKRQYTDKYVVVDGTRPELARFRDVVGRVKTVNMSGRALVEFDDYHLNIGWYDIDPEFLKVVDQPPPKAPKPEVKKPAAKTEAKPMTKPQAAPASAAKGGKASVADILAAARAGKATTEAAPPAAKAQEPAKPQAASKADRSKMSVADMLAAARAGSAAGLLPAKVQAEAAPPPATTQAEEPAPAGEVAAASETTITRVDKSHMSIDDTLAYCRQHDAK